jgi:hypothetical protein
LRSDGPPQLLGGGVRPRSEREGPLSRSRWLDVTALQLKHADLGRRTARRGKTTNLTDAIRLAEASRDIVAQAFAAERYGQYLGHPLAQYEKSLDHLARAVDLFGAQGELRAQANRMAKGARCFSARAGKFEDALAYAARARVAGDHLGDKQLQAWRAMEAEVYVYKGDWEEVVRVVDEALPIAGRRRLSGPRPGRAKRYCRRRERGKTNRGMRKFSVRAHRFPSVSRSPRRCSVVEPLR